MIELAIWNNVCTALNTVAAHVLEVLEGLTLLSLIALLWQARKSLARLEREVSQTTRLLNSRLGEAQGLIAELRALAIDLRRLAPTALALLRNAESTSREIYGLTKDVRPRITSAARGVEAFSWGAVATAVAGGALLLLRVFF